MDNRDEERNTESGLFFLLSVFFFIRWLRAIKLGGRTRSRWNYLLTLLFAGLAIASKSSTLILPIVSGLHSFRKDNWARLLIAVNKPQPEAINQPAEIGDP